MMALAIADVFQWVNLFPEIKEHLMNIFRRYTHVLDAELQQRACEYLALATRDDNEELLQAVCDEMPVFPERESALINRLHSRGDKAQDKRTWVIGQQSENKDRVAERFKSFRKSTVDSANSGGDSPTVPPKAMTQLPQMSASVPAPSPIDTVSRGNTLLEPMMGTTSSAMSDDIMSSLAGLDLSTPSEPVGGERLLPESNLSAEPDSLPSTPLTTRPNDFQHNATLGGVNPSLLAPLTVAPNVDKWLERLSYANEGVLYEDKQVQIGINAEYHGSRGRIALFIGNKIATPFTSVTMTIENPSPEALDIKFHDEPVSGIAGSQQVQEMIQVECRAPFTEPPVLRFTYLAGAFTTLVLRLPIFLSRFVEGVQLESGAFFERWKIIGGPPREAQQIFPITLTAANEVDLDHHSKVLAGHRLSVLKGVDPNQSNHVVAGVLHMADVGKV